MVDAAGSTEVGEGDIGSSFGSDDLRFGSGNEITVLKMNFSHKLLTYQGVGRCHCHQLS